MRRMDILWTIICLLTVVSSIFMIGLLSPVIGLVLAALFILIWKTS